ncbi:MAG: NAD regulator [Hyphomicrobiales bacterium]|nr:NAD regulator [Hyphomicrobiales bacterium]MDE2115992.1 NAD regulator [Hyphomicrobiales bacterium]
MRENVPLILTQHEAGKAAALPSGQFNPLLHRTFEIGLRDWVSEQTDMRLGYVEQLYTFGDRGRHAMPGDVDPHVVSVGYLALTQAEANPPQTQADFAEIYLFLPWEDWRNGRPAIIDEQILPRLQGWAKKQGASGKSDRVQRLFGSASGGSDEEFVLERYELLYEAGLVEEARRDGRENAQSDTITPALGQSMQFDHRRILATALGRLRAKLKYRPVIFELMPELFTLTALQRTVEAISGRALHKQNFRRLVSASHAVEETNAVLTTTGGRPASLYRFAREVIDLRAAVGLRLGRRG